MSEYSIGQKILSAASAKTGAQQTLNNNYAPATAGSKFNSFSSNVTQQQQRHSSSYTSSKRMARSTLFIMIKYSIFVNWTMTGFWIIYNSSDYSINAQIISEKLSSAPSSEHVTVHPEQLRLEKASVVYGLIAYTIITSFVSFFGLVGVCYENFYLTIGLGAGYAMYTICDATFHLLMGVPFGWFLAIMYVMMGVNALALFFLAYLIKFVDSGGHRRDYVASSDRDLSAI